MVVATYTINDERKERITFAGPYYEAGQEHHGHGRQHRRSPGPESLTATRTRRSAR